MFVHRGASAEELVDAAEVLLAALLEEQPLLGPCVFVMLFVSLFFLRTRLAYNLVRVWGHSPRTLL